MGQDQRKVKDKVSQHAYLWWKIHKSQSKRIETNFIGDEIPKENLNYTCIACITIDSVTRMEKKYYPQVYLEECKYKIKNDKKKKRWLSS